MLLVQKAEYEWPSRLVSDASSRNIRVQARRRLRHIRRRQCDDHRATHARPPVAAGETTEDRRACALGRRRPLQEQLGNVAACLQRHDKERRWPRCSASPTCWRRRTRSSGSITHKAQRDSLKMAPTSTIEAYRVCTDFSTARDPREGGVLSPVTGDVYGDPTAARKIRLPTERMSACR